ncbi:MAG: hypothetical protein MAG795_00699 [Candidatus Woesearchaeota archaeon]|nr:hypothetical protein [Candidatus Woesearchaeota archaeon]
MAGIKQKNWFEVQSMLANDDDLIKKVCSGFSSYSEQINSIKDQPLSKSSVDKIVYLTQELDECFAIPEKYSWVYNLDDIVLGASEKINKIGQLKDEFFNSLDYFFDELSQGWDSAKKRVESWERKYGIEDLLDSRDKLNSFAETYDLLFTRLGQDHPILNARMISQIQDYVQFLDDFSNVDVVYFEFKNKCKENLLFRADPPHKGGSFYALHFDTQIFRLKSPRPKGRGFRPTDILSKELDSKTKQELNVLGRELKKIRKTYDKTCAKHRPFFDKLKQNSIFAYKERFIDMQELDKRIDYLKKNVQNIDIAQQDLDEWIDYYQQTLDYLSEENEIEKSHIEWVADCSTTTPKIVEDWENNIYVAEKIGQVSALRKVVHNRVEQELNRIKTYLDSSLDDFSDLPSDTIDLEERLEELHQFKIMYKLIGEPTLECEKVHEKIEAKIRQSKIPKTIAQTTKKPSSVQQDNMPYWKPIIRNQSGYFDIATHLLTIGFPSGTYMNIMNTMLGKNNQGSWAEKLRTVSQDLEDLPIAGSLQDLDYMYHLEYALRESMNRGNMDHLVSRNSQGWKLAHQVLNQLNKYISISEDNIGLSAKQIELRKPVTGPENTYNPSLALY